MPSLILPTFGSEWEPDDWDGEDTPAVGPVCAECGERVDDGPALYCPDCEAELRLAPVATVECDPVIDFDLVPF